MGNFFGYSFGQFQHSKDSHLFHRHLSSFGLWDRGFPPMLQCLLVQVSHYNFLNQFSSYLQGQLCLVMLCHHHRVYNCRMVRQIGRLHLCHCSLNKVPLL